MHDEQGAADHPLGAQGGHRRHAASAGSRTSRHAHPPPDRRARVRNAQGLDGATHFKTKRLKNVAAELSLQVLAYNLKRVIAILGVQPLISGMQA